MKPKTEFNLRSTVLATMAESLEADPSQVADLVLARIAAKDYRDALSQCLRQYVRQTISENRMNSQVVSRGASSSSPRPSVKVAGIRAAWKAVLEDRVHVGPDGWKFLGDCTVPDLMHLADYRRDQAARNGARADQYEGLAKLLADHGVDRVSDLPESVLETALRRAT